MGLVQGDLRMWGNQESFRGEKGANRHVFASLYWEGTGLLNTMGDLQICSEDQRSRGRAVYLRFPLRYLQRHSLLIAGLPKRSKQQECV